MTYRTTGGWGAPLDAALDGEQTLVLTFAAPRVALPSAPFDDIAEVLPQSLLAGFCGEISPAVPGGASELHNQTMTVTVFSEA